MLRYHLSPHMDRPQITDFGAIDLERDGSAAIFRDDARRKIMRRVHEGAEVRLMGGYADGSGVSKTDPCRVGFGPSKLTPLLYVNHV
jgi:hypothetical protein